jgi:hypothetical protein
MITSFIGIFSSSNPAPIPDILWWKLNEGSGGIMGATVGVDGATNAFWVAGQNGSGFSLEFVGSDETIAFSDSPINYASTNVITVCFWVNLDDVTDVRIVFESSEAWDNSGGWLIYTGTGTMIFGIHDAIDNSQRSIPFSTGVWTHVAVVLNMAGASGSMTVYKNGVETATSIVTNSFNGPLTLANDILYMMGRATTSLFHIGKIDDVRIYGRALTTNEVEAVYSSPQ